MESNEKRLFHAAQAGDANAFGALYALYANELYRYAYAILRDRHAAEDAVQETFLKAYRGLPKFRGDCSEKTWLICIAVLLFLLYCWVAYSSFAMT